MENILYNRKGETLAHINKNEQNNFLCVLRVCVWLVQV